MYCAAALASADAAVWRRGLVTAGRPSTNSARIGHHRRVGSDWLPKAHHRLRGGGWPFVDDTTRHLAETLANPDASAGQGGVIRSLGPFTEGSPCGGRSSTEPSSPWSDRGGGLQRTAGRTAFCSSSYGSRTLWGLVRMQQSRSWTQVWGCLTFRVPEVCPSLVDVGQRPRRRSSPSDMGFPVQPRASSAKGLERGITRVHPSLRRR